MFIPQKNADGAVAPFEYLPCGAITPKVGLALVLSNGNLAIAGSTVKPEYICMEERATAVAAGTIIPVIAVDDQTIYETKLSAAGSSLKLGDKVTLAADGLRVTATKTDGVAQIVNMEGTATGSVVHVRF